MRRHFRTNYVSTFDEVKQMRDRIYRKEYPFENSDRTSHWEKVDVYDQNGKAYGFIYRVIWYELVK